MSTWWVFCRVLLSSHLLRPGAYRDPGDAAGDAHRDSAARGVGAWWHRFWQWLGALIGRAGQWLVQAYAVTLGWALKYRRLTLLSLVLAVLFNGYLFTSIPKGLFPQQDTGDRKSVV